MNLVPLISLGLVSINPTYPIIGTFDNPPMTNCSLEESSNMKNWQTIPGDEVYVLPNGDWLIDLNSSYMKITSYINGNKMFFRIVGQSVTNQ